LAGKQGIARRRASGGGRVSIGEAKSLFCEAIQVGRPHARGAVATDVSEPEIIRENNNNVGQGARDFGGHPSPLARDYQAKNEECDFGLTTGPFEARGLPNKAWIHDRSDWQPSIYPQCSRGSPAHG
jgi:hypothetical protein